MAGKAESSQIAIRTAQFSDAPRLAPLASQLGYASAPDQAAIRLRDILADPHHVVFVAENENGGLVGYADVFVLRTVASDPRAEIAGLVVDQASRSENIGRMLMARAEAWARENGCSECSLRSNVIRERAHRFYEKLGYHVNKTQKSFRKTL